jgi:hypothetical protein
MLIYEYTLDGNKAQYGALVNAIRVVQFIRNKCLRLWMDERGIGKNDLQCYKRLGRDDLYGFVRDGKVASQLEEPRIPTHKCRGVSDKYQL